MIISKTPYRISFFGGGTDFPHWYKEYGGAVLSTTIDKYCYISCRRLPPFFAHKHRFVYSIIEDVVALSEVKHPAIRGILQWLDIQEGLEIHHDGDLPARSGLGSSSSFTVGLLHVLSAYRNVYYSKADLARDAIHCEQNVIGEVVGSQDQVAAAYGGFNHITFGDNPEFLVKPVMMAPENENKLNDNLLLFFTGIQRTAGDIEAEKLEKLKKNASSMRLINEAVNEALSMLVSKNLNMESFGKLMHESWLIKRSLSNGVSNYRIDQAYEKARSLGAIGGKILGAGGGGFMLLFAHPSKHKSIVEELKPYVHVPFQFEKNGSTIALYQPGGL